MPTWNEAQKKAVYTRDKNVLVSASAGAGKTTVLIARLSELVVNERIGVDHILAMTFTEAAANEMKKRLAASLYDLMEQASEPEEKQYLSTQLTAIQNAHISTIHSFCLSILQEFYYTIDLSAAMVANIMSEGDGAQARAKAMDEVLHRRYRRGDEAFYRLCVMFSARAENDEALKEAIYAISVQANAQSDPSLWLTRCRSMYREYASLDELPPDMQDLFLAGLARRIEGYMQSCEQILRRYETIYPKEGKKADQVQRKCDSFASLRNALTHRNYADIRTAMIASAHVIIPTPPDKEDDTYKRLREHVMQSEDELLGMLYEERLLLSDIAQLEEPVETLIELCRDYMETFARIKREMECIDFDDMEHFALRILQANHGEIAAHYRALFDEIMVDEFQDTNEVQNELVKLIARENNVFRVGDIKQSIYGFRHARPQLMRSLIDTAGEQDEVIYLSNNYRSKQMIVDFNNQLFSELMNLPGFDMRYAQSDHVACGIGEQEKDNVPICFHAIDAAAVKEDGDVILSANELKASYIASQIIAIKEREQRNWKDFVILVRANERKKDLKQAFERLSIPCFIAVSGGFYQSHAVSIVLSLCNALADPYDDIPFAAAMLSPLFQLSVQAMSDLRLAKGEAGFYAYMVKINHPLIAEFEALRKLLYRDSVCELLNAIYAMRDFYAHHTTAQERTNLDLLYEQAIAFEQKEGKGALSFLHSLNEIKDMESSEAMPIGSEDDVVRVMSIHQSKGLQFPIVFLWSNSRQDAQSFRELYLCDSELGLGMQYMDIQKRFVRPTVYRMALEHKYTKEELAEEMRILYVATTRAQQQLHIVDCVKAQTGETVPLSSALVYERGGYTSWILHSRLAHESTPLFRIQRVDRMWREAQGTLSEEHEQFSMVYQQEDAVYQIVTPSEIAHPLPFTPLSQASKEAMRYGTRMHAWIEALPKGRWEAKDYRALTPSPNRQELYALQKLNEDPLFQRANTYPHIYHELPFTVMDRQTVLHGFMDFAAIGEDIIIIDFKSDHVEHVGELAERYRDQLLAYEKAMHILYPQHIIHTYLYSLSLHEFIEVSRQKVRG